MPTYVLEGGAAMTLPARPVSVRLQAGRSGSTAVRLQAATEDGSPVRSITPTPGMLVVPQVPSPVTVRAMPIDGDRFGPGTVLSLVIGYESRDELDPDRGVLEGVDVSGLRGRDLFTLDPQQGAIRVQVLGPAAAESPLSPLAARARDAARAVLGTDQLGPRQATDALILIDTSVSMLPLIDDGTVGGVVEVLAGVHRVIGRAQADSLQIALQARTPKRLGPAAPERVAEVLGRAVHQLPRVTGFRLSGGLAPAGEGPGQVWVVTDGVPAEAWRLAERPELHLVLPMAESVRELGVSSPLPTTVIGLPDPHRGGGAVGDPAAAGLERYPGAMDEIVGSLLGARWRDRAGVAGSGR